MLAQACRGDGKARSTVGGNKGNRGLYSGTEADLKFAETHKCMKPECDQFNRDQEKFIFSQQNETILFEAVAREGEKGGGTIAGFKN